MSPRPKKPRHCDCPHRPSGMVMKPAGVPTKELQKIVLEIDELEALRLCDREGLSQAAAGEHIGIMLHHQCMNEAAFAMLDGLLRYITRTPRLKSVTFNDFLSKT